MYDVATIGRVGALVGRSVCLPVPTKVRCSDDWMLDARYLDFSAKNSATDRPWVVVLSADRLLRAATNKSARQ